jgi:hypothetical protein
MCQFDEFWWYIFKEKIFKIREERETLHMRHPAVLLDIQDPGEGIELLP